MAQADDEPEPSTSMSTEPCDTSPPRVLWTYGQHVANYVRLMVEEREVLTLGEDRAAPLITKVFSPTSHMLILEFTLNSFSIHSQLFMLSCSIHHLVFFQTLQKIHLANHPKSMVELPHAEAIQQLEVAVLGSPAAHVIDLLSAGWMQMTPAAIGTVICPPQVYTSTPAAPRLQQFQL